MDLNALFAPIIANATDVALTGSFGVLGGNMASGPGRAVLKDSFMGTRRQRIDAEQDLSHEQFPAWAKLVSHETQVVRIADYIEGKGDYPIRNLLPFGMWPRPDKLEEAFEKLDFFVSADLYMTDTCKFADIVLPVQTSLEREQITVFGLDHIFYQGHVVEPMGEARTDMDIITGIAEKLGVTIGGDEPIYSHEDFLIRFVRVIYLCTCFGLSPVSFAMISTVLFPFKLWSIWLRGLPAVLFIASFFILYANAFSL